MRHSPRARFLSPFRPQPAPWCTASLLVLLLLAICAPLGALRAHGQSPAPKRAALVAVPKDVGELKAIQAKIEQVAAKVLPCTVVVRIGEAQGSGVVVSKDGYVLSAAHVVGEPGQKAAFVFADGKIVNGITLGIDRDNDAGLLKITDAGPWPFTEMCPAGLIKPGMWCVTLGHPLGYQAGRPPVVRAGRVLQVRDGTLQTDCTIVAGDSGGPVIDLDGRVIAINSRINAPMPTMNFHVPIDSFHQSWEKLVMGDKVQTAALGRDSGEVRAAFAPTVAEAGRCVVRVRCEDRNVALGTIVGPDGWVLTKASQLKGPTICRTADGKDRDARLVGVNEGLDLAMLKIDAVGLPALPWSGDAPPAVGRLVASVGVATERPLAVGVVGVPLRKIPAIYGMLGITLAVAEKPAQIVTISPGSGAEKAGLQVKDIVTHVNGVATNTRSELQATLKQFRPGRTVQVTVKRGDKTLQVAVTLSVIDTPGTRRRDMQNLANPGVSARHDDFPKVLQHDTVLVPTDCGGPLVDLSGRVVGLNIARGGRTETYALPTDVVLGQMYDLMSGRLSPKPPAQKPPEPKAEAKASSKPAPKAEPKPAPKTEPKPEAKPAPKSPPTPDVKPELKPQPKPATKPEPKAESKPESKPQPKPEAKPAKPQSAPPGEPAKKPAT